MYSRVENDMSSRSDASVKIGVVIPCFRVRSHVLGVLAEIGPEIDAIYCIDDACPESSGDYIEEGSSDPRVRVLRHNENQGVGGAILTGYRTALADGMTVIVKIDGDGQLDPKLIGQFVRPILDGSADYSKGNRFFYLENTQGMPKLRVFGNVVLSFFTKISSGYWNVFDPTNGYTAIHKIAAESLINRPVAKRYFFESDMLFHLNLQRAVVIDIPMESRYGSEESSLYIGRIIIPFIKGHIRNTIRRTMITYFVRDFNVASLELIIGALLLSFGFLYGSWNWANSVLTNTPATSGTVMLAAIPTLVAIQLLIGAVNFDIQNVPRIPKQRFGFGEQSDVISVETSKA